MYNILGFLDNGMTHRGCMSDAPTTPGRVACTANNNYCYKCSTSGCNTIAYSEPNPLSCVTCNSATNANCATEVNGTLSTRCGNTLLGRSTECYTYTDGATTIRGCTNDVVSPCNTPTPNCLTCRATNCNVEDYCLVCSTAQDENCRANTRSLVPQSCARNGAQKGCYRRELPGKLNHKIISNHFIKWNFPIQDYINLSFYSAENEKNIEFLFNSIRTLAKVSRLLVSNLGSVKY